ncbi:hypothetical protein [Nocardia sp. NPDC004860]|uniref:hypothetical protein n=1 Tax=Nocardia sp. NPDC004860 TaxID=3154557 RepID=UPI0033AAD008
MRDQIAALRHDLPAHDRYVVDATLLRSRSDGAQSIDDYDVLDRIGPRPIALTIRYRTRITWDENDGSVIYATPLPFGIHLHTRHTCQAEGEKTRIRETVDVTAPPVLLPIVYRGVATAQTRLLAHVKATAESASADGAEALGHGPDS